MTTDRKALEVRITGRVQGVGFRDWTAREAETLGLTGWVRNEADGSVRALLAGPESLVSEMVERLRAGPRAAAVAAVDVEEGDPAEAPPVFRVTA